MEIRKKVLVTGKSGFVGTNLSNYLEERNFDVVGVSRRKESSELTYDHISGVRDIEVWIHLAGEARDARGISKLELYKESNFYLTRRVFDTFLESENSKVFIFLSTIKAAVSHAEHMITENDRGVLNDAYGISKRAAEDYILGKIGYTEKSVYILRPSIIYGLGMKGNLKLLYKLVEYNCPWPLGNFRNKRSLCSVNNLLFVIEELMKNTDIPSGIYNVADDDLISVNEIIKVIGSAVNRRPIILNVPMRIIQSISMLFLIFRLRSMYNAIEKLTESLIVSNEKIVRAIGKTMPITTGRGLYDVFRSLNQKL